MAPDQIYESRTIAWHGCDRHDSFPWVRGRFVCSGEDFPMRRTLQVLGGKGFPPVAGLANMGIARRENPVEHPEVEVE
jgi:hypothetical protein